MEKLLVAERRGRLGLVLRVHGAKQEQPGRGHAERLPEIRDGAFEPRVAEEFRRHEQHHQHGQQCAGADQDEQRQPVLKHDLDADRGDRGDHQEIQRSAGDAFHLVAVDQGRDAEPLERVLDDEAADHAQREEREPGEDTDGRLREDRDLQVPAAEQDRVADRHGRPDQRAVPRQRVDGVAQHRLASGGGLFPAAVDPLQVEPVHLLQRHEVMHVAAPVRPVHQDHADDDRDDHAHGRHGVTQRDAVAPVVFLEHGRHAAHRAVSALESDLQQVAERWRQPEERHQHESGQAESQHILSPRDELPEAELRERHRDHSGKPRRGHAEEESREDHVDEEARQLADGGNDVRRDHVGKAFEDDEGDRAADDGAGEIEFLQERDEDAQEFSQHQKQRQNTENQYGGHKRSLWNKVKSGYEKRKYKLAVPERKVKPFLASSETLFKAEEKDLGGHVHLNLPSPPGIERFVHEGFRPDG